MGFEAEVYWLLPVCFGVVVAGAALTLAVLFRRTGNKSLFWFGGQLLALIASFCCFYMCVSNIPYAPPVMYSEEHSLTLALAGIFWAVSMALMLVGVGKLLKGPKAE